MGRSSRQAQKRVPGSRLPHPRELPADVDQKIDAFCRKRGITKREFLALMLEFAEADPRVKRHLWVQLRKWGR